MAKHGALLFFHAFPILILAMSLFCKATSDDREVSIVYLGSLPDGVYSPLSQHHSILRRIVAEGSSLENLLVRSYKRSFNGFAAHLTDQERDKLAKMKEVVSVFPSRTYQLQTTRSWDFMGFHEKINHSTVESDIVVGSIDSGISPESESFKDEGFGPPPKTWKGACEGGTNFTCNKKLIGARYYVEDSARDGIGHGTHTASTATGNAVKDVSFYGLAQGTARGGVPAARIAAYKACATRCKGHDILAAFDDAIADGVDIITISIGFGSTQDLYEDVIAIGAFHAMEKGILTSNSAGNDGPEDGTVSSLAPWILTVAASSMDRRIIDKVVLGNGSTVVGHSINSFTLNGTSFPLVHGKDASRNCTEGRTGECSAEGCLDSDKVKGKIVLCDDYDRGINAAYNAGALGSVLYSFRNNDDHSLILPFAATTLYLNEYSDVMYYLNSTSDPRGTILKSEAVKDPAAPLVALFSSRGPNPILPDIIKPDISAPGVQVLAAFSPDASISTSPADNRRVKYNIKSGTSMACPHAAGVAAYVKTFHPDWSPAAIKSSLMTTAWPMNDTHSYVPTYEFAYGSGHIDPVKAINPGLVYEASKEEYIRLLCMLYDEARVRLVSGDNSTCPTSSDKGSPRDHNYPSMGARVEPMKPFTVKFHRRVKNVGLTNSTYTAKIFSNPKVEIKVVPEVLSFKSLNEEMSFNATVSGSGFPNGTQVSAALVWFDGAHNVRSPIVVNTAAKHLSN